MPPLSSTPKSYSADGGACGRGRGSALYAQLAVKPPFHLSKPALAPARGVVAPGSQHVLYLDSITELLG